MVSYTSLCTQHSLLLLKHTLFQQLVLQWLRCLAVMAFSHISRWRDVVPSKSPLYPGTPIFSSGFHSFIQIVDLSFCLDFLHINFSFSCSNFSDVCLNLHLSALEFWSNISSKRKKKHDVLKVHLRNNNWLFIVITYFGK